MRNLESLTLVKKGAKNTGRARFNKDTIRIVKASIIKLLRELLEKNKDKIKELTQGKVLVEYATRTPNLVTPMNRFTQRDYKHKKSSFESLIPAPRPTKFIPII